MAEPKIYVPKDQIVAFASEIIYRNYPCSFSAHEYFPA
jgi:hypothetical protein